MAFVSGTFSYAMYQTQWFFGGPTVANANRLEFSDGTIRTVLLGEFTFDERGVPSGTLTGYQRYILDELVLSFSDFRADLDSIIRAEENGVLEAFMKAVLRQADTIIGSEFQDGLTGWDGNDRLNGRGGDDFIYGDSGNDTLFGGAGDDKLFGGAGRDTLIGNAGADRIDGGIGRDTVSYAGAGVGVVVDLFNPAMNQGPAAQNVLFSIESVIGTSFADALTGNNGSNVLDGGNGSDVLFGRGGLDTLLGGNGNDSLYGGWAADLHDGGGGRDTAMYDDLTDRVRADLLLPQTNTGFAKGDRYVSIENLLGSFFADVLGGDNGNNVIQGAFGNDHLLGRGAGTGFTAATAMTS